MQVSSVCVPLSSVRVQLSSARVQVSYKELLAYFEKKLNCRQHQQGSRSGGTLSRGKTLNKFEAVYISVQEALASTGATLDVAVRA